MNDHTMTSSILICGAGVAGLATAHFLLRAGHAVTVVERSSTFRGGGQAVDVRGVALDVVARMGLLDAVREQRTRLKGMSVLDRDGRELCRNVERTMSGGRLDSGDVEIFRDDLCRLLMSRCHGAEMIGGDHATALHDDGNGVDVHFASGTTRRFDLVIGADGLRSHTRRLVFDATDECVVELGAVLALFTAPNNGALTDWELMYREAERGVVAYPTTDNRELRVGAGFGADVRTLRGNEAAQKALVAQRCADLGGAWRPMLDALETRTPFWFGEIAQVHLPAWHRGRVALVGDAAYCASPFSGQGTSLALVGAFVLADSLASCGADFAAAFSLFETRMRPFAEANQRLVDLARAGPIPDEQMDAAKNGIVLDAA